MAGKNSASGEGNLQTWPDFPRSLPMDSGHIIKAGQAQETPAVPGLASIGAVRAGGQKVQIPNTEIHLINTATQDWKWDYSGKAFSITKLLSFLGLVFGLVLR